MPDLTAQFHLELRSAGNRFLTDLPYSDPARVVSDMRFFVAAAPEAYGPRGTHRLVVPAGRVRLFKPDAAAWQASAERRKAGA